MFLETLTNEEGPVENTVTTEIATRFFESLAMTRVCLLSLRGAERRSNLTSFNSSKISTILLEGGHYARQS